ncbi:hypothetical protein [Paenibacillus melissococcoides]|nr:hypothetical protein [Paenibacillus melissococcoides]CAH8721323.1 hypothetical protein HTL2_006305 [Paenibacillus melissococcoides]
MDEQTITVCNIIKRFGAISCARSQKDITIRSYAGELVNVMVNDGVIISPDISKHLGLLIQEGLLEYSNERVNSYNAYANDAVIRLTVKGIDLLEGSTPDDPGVAI